MKAARTPSLGDIAAKSNVSTALASYALNGTGRVSAETRKRIIQVAEELGYHPNRYAKLLRSGKGTGYGFLIRNMKNPFFLDVLESVATFFEKPSQTLSIMDSRYMIDQQQRLLDSMAAAGMAATLVAGVGGERPLVEWEREHPGNRMNIVTLNVAESANEAARRYSSINVDHVHAVRTAVSYLHDRGHRRLWLFAAPKREESDGLRTIAFHDVCAEQGLEGIVVRTPLFYQSVLQCCAKILMDVPGDVSFIFNSDYLAFAAYEAARQVGRTVGGDVNIIGHDDLDVSRLMMPALTSFSFSREVMSESIIDALTSETPIHRTVPVTLVERDSVS